MSKLFPMFKRKGKGKDEEVEEDTKKKHGKVGKHSKGEHLGPSPRTTAVAPKSDKKRKEKAVKRKAPTPNGKENRPLETGLERHDRGDFYVDDTGTVRESPHQKVLVEDVAASEEDLDSGTGENPELENKQEDLNISKGLEDNIVTCIQDMGEVSGDEGISQIIADRYLGVPHKGYCVEKDVADEPVDDHSEVCEEVISTEKGDLCEENTLDDNIQFQDIQNKPVTIIDGEVNEEVSSGESMKQTLCDSTKDDDTMSNFCDVNESPQTEVETCEGELELVDVEKAADGAQDLENVSHGATSDWQKSLVGKHSRTNDDKVDEKSGESIKVVLDDDSKILEESVADISVNSNDVSMQEDRVDSVDGKTDTQFVSLTDSQSMHDSQDSDDDFDSAQEDWDEEDDTGGSPLNPTAKEGINESGLSRGLEHLEILEEVNEATNDILINRKCEEMEVPQLLREPSSSSSVYQDASFSFEDSEIVNIASLVDASNEECAQDSLDENSKKTKGFPGRLARKTSNISTASSDIFNEELDELLDEELDRLSEEEVDNVNHKSLAVEGVDAKTSESTIDTVASALQREGFALETIKAVETIKQENENVMPMSDIDIEISDHNGITKEVCEDDQDILDGQSTGGRMANTLLLKEPSYSTVVSEEKNTGTEESVTSPPLLSCEEALDEAKDSGCYSLPVSPKPVVVERGVETSGEVGQGADDSFGHSEEEGMVTPPTEVSPLPEEAGNPAEENVAIKESVLDSSVVDESALLYRSCCESRETAEIKNISKLEEGMVVAKEESIELTEFQNVSKHKAPKIDIPKSIGVEFREGGASPVSPRGSYTPSRHLRHKSPMLDFENKHHGDEALPSPDPIGDRFLQHAVCLSHEEAEARLAQRRAARAEARELRLRELEKQQQDQENEDEKQFATPSLAEPSPRSAGAGRTSIRTAGINCTGQYSRRSSEDSTTDESLPANVREMRAELKELDEKFRKAMITNAQLDNEKATLTYEVELIKDRYTELEEVHTQLSKEHRKKCTEYEQLRKVSTKLQEEVKILRSLLQERDQLIQEYGLVVVGEEEEEKVEEVESEKDDDDMDDLTPRKIAVKKVLLSQEAAELLEKGAAKGSLDIRLKKFGEEKNDLEDQVRRLKLELEEERNKNRRRENGLDYEKQKEQNKTVNEYKFRVQKAEAEVSTLQANVARLDALSARYKTQSEELERSEEELKLEKRKLQRELRDAQSRLEELETTNNHLIKRFDKLKNARSTLLKDLSLDPV